MEDFTMKLNSTAGATLAAATVIALMSATSVTPASAQGVPAGLSRSDPAQPSHDTVQLTEQQRAKVRGAYALSRKTRPSQQ
jgi:Spy/CpxP family protein refolding chaperone